MTDVRVGSPAPAHLERSVALHGLPLVPIALREGVGPMEQRLADDGRHIRVVVAAARLEHLATELPAPPPLRSGACLPARDLSRVVGGAAPLEEAAVPLEPAAWVLRRVRGRRVSCLQWSASGSATVRSSKQAERQCGERLPARVSSPFAPRTPGPGPP